VDRVACVDLPELPLQILLRRHSDWEAQPVAVVERDKPLGIIQWVNERARAYGILAGMRYATGLSLSRELRAGVVAEGEIAEEVSLLTRRLWSFSPRIEPSSREPGVFWLDASGLVPLYPSLEAWASAIREDLHQACFEAVVAVGFSRFGTYAAAKSRTTNIVFRNPKQEQAHLRAVPVNRLEFDPSLRDALGKLGIGTLGGFVDLPSTGIRKRFGPEAHELHRLACGDGWTRIEPRRLLEPVEKKKLFDSPESSLDRLLVEIEAMLRSVLLELAQRQEALSSVQFSLLLDNGKEETERLTPAAPTLDSQQLLSLIRLRMETLSLSSGVMEMRIQGVGAPASLRQLELFREAPRRNLAAVHRAFAKIRAELGNNAVVHARLHDAHLPEACFGWEPLNTLIPPKPARVAMRPLVRRIYSPPVELPPRARHEPDGWLITRFSDGPVEEVIGPHILSTDWWTREISRAYHYVRTRNGRWLWIYNDRKRRRWFLHGEVE
jgi:protein ImuB